MSQRTWLITGVNSGFGRLMTEQLLGAAPCAGFEPGQKVRRSLPRRERPRHVAVSSPVYKIAAQSHQRVILAGQIEGNRGYCKALLNPRFIAVAFALRARRSGNRMDKEPRRDL